MHAAFTTVFNLGLQLLVAAALAGAAAGLGRGPRRQRLLRVRAWRTLGRMAPFAAVGVGLVWGLARLGVTTLAWEPVPMLVPGLATLVGSWGTGGLALTLAAGRSERSGRLAVARRTVALGGRGAFIGAAGQIVLWGVTFFAQPGEGQRALVAADTVAGQAGLGAMLLGSGGFVALLAALTGKPRPSGPAGALLYGGGYFLLVAAALALIN